MRAPCMIIFKASPIIDGKIKYHEKETVFYIKTTMQKTYDKSWVLDYLEARIRLKYIGMKISRHLSIGKASRNKIQTDVEITTCKRMITKISNALHKYEEEQRKTLLPDFESERYTKTKNKLEEYKKRLNRAKNDKL